MIKILCITQILQRHSEAEPKNPRKVQHNDWILHFAFAPFRMTIPAQALALILTFGAIGESRAECTGADLNTVGINEKSNYCGTCGTNCNWVVENNTLKITGGANGEIGRMAYYGYAEISRGKYKYLTNNPWKDLEINSVDVQGVENLGDFAFMGMGITNITMDDNVKVIKQDALFGNKLSSLKLPDSITEIRFGGLNNSVDKKLDVLVLPDSLTTLEQYAIEGISDTIIMTDTLTSISNNYKFFAIFSANPSISVS